MRMYNINASIIQAFENLNKRLNVQICSMAVLETGSELLVVFAKDAYSPKFL